MIFQTEQDASLNFVRNSFGEWELESVSPELIALFSQLTIAYLFDEPGGIVAWLEACHNDYNSQLQNPEATPTKPLLTELRLFSIPILLSVSPLQETRTGESNTDEAHIQVTMLILLDKLELLSKMQILADTAETAIHQASLEQTLVEKNLRHFKHWLYHFLGTIRVMTELGKTDKATKLLDKIKDYFGAMLKENLTIGDVNINELLKELADRHMDVAQTKKIRFNTDLPIHNFTIEADSHKLAAALENVLINALKILENHRASIVHPTITISLAETAITQVRPAGIIITIEDNGPGFDADPVSFLTDGSQSRDPRRKTGTAGLGLAYLAKIVQDHGGTLTIFSSTEGIKGAQFVIFLPFKHPTQNSPQSSPAAPATPASST